MAIPIFTVTRKWSGDQSRTESNDGKTGLSENQLVFDVISSIPANAELAKWAPGIPRIGFFHPDNVTLRCRAVNSAMLSPIHFEVVCDFFAETITENGSPLNDPPKISFYSIDSEEEIDEDVDGNPIVTDAGEPITGLTIPVSDLAFRVTRNLPVFDPNVIRLYKNKVNSEPFLQVPKGMVKINDIRAENAFADNIEFWIVNAEFQIREPLRSDVTPDKAWWKRVAHKGYRVNVTDAFSGSVASVEATDDNDEPVTRPVFLKLGSGEQETDKTKGHWKLFEVFKSIDFNSLNLFT